MTIFDELVAEAHAVELGNESRVIPLFDQQKVPNYTGWSSPDWEREAVEWHDVGHVVSGSFFWMQQCGCVVLDPEGKMFGRTGYTEATAAAWPAWVRLARQLADVLPSWTSAGGDGGLGIRNVLLPLSRARLEALVKNAAILQALPIDPEWKLAARAPLAGVEWGEVLTKHGVCIPPGRVDGQLLELSLDPDGLEWTLARARQIWTQFEEWTVHILTEALIVGSKERTVVGGNDGDMPVMLEIEEALVWRGVEAAIETTHDIIRAGGSRHYACKTWAEYAYQGILGRGGEQADIVRSGARSNVDDAVSSRIIDQIWTSWARDYSEGDDAFMPRDVRKAVIDSRRFLFGKRQA